MSRPFGWRWLARVLHRDLGYFFFGATVVYALSGLAINHKNHWNPSYTVWHRFFKAEPIGSADLDEAGAKKLLDGVGLGASSYRQHYAPDGQSWKIFFDGGTATLRNDSGLLEVEKLERRPLFHLTNKLHYNPGLWWTIFSDAFAVGLILISITGLFLLRGHHGITRRGGLLVLAGLAVPGLLCALYL